MRCITTSCVLLCAAAVPVQAQMTSTWGLEHRTVRYQYQVVNPTGSAAGAMDLYVPLPQECPRQEIHYLHLSVPGFVRVFTDEDGQRLAHYAIERIEPGAIFEVGFVAGVSLRNLRWLSPDASVGPGGPVLSDEERQRYLAPAAFYSMDSEFMRDTAQRLTAGAESEHEKLQRIHDHIVNSIRYVRDGRWDPAAVVLARGTGSCSEYNYVLSGLCRLAGLPTRYVGGSSSGFEALPATDTVYHRWTEVFLTGVGWFPVDCSRNANPLRGPRSHFGRVYTDMLVWCRQGGGGEYLAWEYRGNTRVKGRDPGLRHDHRTRWHAYLPEDRVTAAYDWFMNGEGPVPDADALECAVLRWGETEAVRHPSMLNALAVAGRIESLRRAAQWPDAEELREAWVNKLCTDPRLAAQVIKLGNDLYELRDWFRGNEARLRRDGAGRFTLERAPASGRGSPFTDDPLATVWRAAAEDLLAAPGFDVLDRSPVKVAVMSAIMQGDPLACAASGALLRDALVRGIDGRAAAVAIDADAFGRWLAAHGPGEREHWLYAAGEPVPSGTGLPDALRPDVILVPVVVSEFLDSPAPHLRHTITVRGLVVSTCRLFMVSTVRCREGL